MQSEYVKRVGEYTNDFFDRRGRRPKFFIKTYGCQMNVRESEQLAGMLVAMGFLRNGSENGSDLIAYNTCCIRQNAENKTIGNIGLAKFYKETNPDLTVVFCGCMARQPGYADYLQKNHPYIDIILGTNERWRFPEHLAAYFNEKRSFADISDAYGEPSDYGVDAGVLVSRNHRHKAGVSVSYGCGNFCSYCIVPRVRGMERSRAASDVLAEAEALAQDGVRELTLLGQNVNSYNGDGSGIACESVSFARLLEMADGIGGIERIRFLTSHPKDFSRDLIDAMGSLNKVCKSVHLPMQSGSTKILEAMNRKYTKEQYLGLVDLLRASVPGVSVTTDIIVGYPGETEEDFCETLDAVNQAGFEGAFTFIYSKREGTPSSKIPYDLREETVKERFERLIGTLNLILLKKNESMLSKTLAVMAEDDPPGADGALTGRTDGNALVHFYGAASPGEIVEVKITEAKTFYLVGERV